LKIPNNLDSFLIMGAVDKQQRMTNMLLAGNLYKSHKIDQGLQKVASIQQEAIKQNQVMHRQSLAQGSEMIAKQDKGNRIAEAQLHIQLTQAQEIRQTKLLKNTFFEISEEVEDVLKEKKITTIEKYFRYGSIKATMEKNGIDTDITDELSEKKLIRDTIKKVESEISKAEKKFNKNDKKDLEEIYQALEVDEEHLIQKLNSSEVDQLKEKAKKLKEWYESALKVANGGILALLLPSKNDDCMVEECRKRAKDKKSLILPNHFKNKSTSKKIFEHTGLESLESILGSKVFENWYNAKFKIFFTEMGLWDETNYKILGDDALVAVIAGETKSFLGKVKPWDDQLKSHVLNYRKPLIKLKKCCDEAFNNPFSKYVFDKASTDGYKKNKKEIKNLEKDIEDEKKILKEIFKKHPFVKTILSNR
jgi:hypothetical protein